jgi:uncharacterized protein YqeY
VTIKSELADELRDAMLSRDALRRDVIRQVETEVTRKVTEPGFEGDADDELYRAVIGSYVKKMSKARDEYAELGERGEAMAAKLDFEVRYLSRWLPSTLSEDDTRALVQSTIAEIGEVTSPGMVIGRLMKAHGNQLDGSMVNRIVREELG